MTRTAACLLFLGAATVAAGIGLIYVPAGVIAAGALGIAAGVLLLERHGDPDRATPAAGRDRR